MNTRRRKHVSLREWGEHVTPRKNALMRWECLPREISAPGVCVSFFFPRVQRQLARRAVLLTEPEKAGSPGRSERGTHSVIGSRAAFNVTRRL